MDFSQVLESHGSTMEQWQDEVQEEYLGQMFWFMFTGTTDNSIVHVSEKLGASGGTAVTTQIASEIKGGTIRGGGQIGVGNEGEMDFYPFRSTVDEVRQLVAFKDRKMSDQRVAFDILSRARPKLVEKMRWLTEHDITDALTDTSVGRVQGRYRYGSSEANWNVTEATAKANIADGTDDLSTGTIAKLSLKARNPINAHVIMRPWRVKGMSMAGSQEWYVLVAHDYAVDKLVMNDPLWNNSMLNIPPMSNGSNPIFTGTSFKGNYNGVLVYQWNNIPLESSTVQISHNLFLGAQAAVFNWAQHSEMSNEVSDHGHQHSFEINEIRGIKKVVWDRASVDSNITNEDSGVIHYYTPAPNP